MQYHNSEVITVNVILKHIDEAFELAKRNEIESFTKSYDSSMIKIIAGFLTRKFVSKLGYKIERLRESTYRITESEKSWSIDFLSYIFQSSHISFPLKIFKDSQSRYEIQKFVRNKVYCALLDQAPRSILFDEKRSKIFTVLLRNTEKC
ncbi:MAG: hypothetical protein QXD95_08030 [Nitrososphaeria archaeon]